MQHRLKSNPTHRSLPPSDQFHPAPDSSSKTTQPSTPRIQALSLGRPWIKRRLSSTALIAQVKSHRTPVNLLRHTRRSTMSAMLIWIKRELLRTEPMVGSHRQSHAASASTLACAKIQTSELTWLVSMALRHPLTRTSTRITERSMEVPHLMFTKLVIWVRPIKNNSERFSAISLRKTPSES